MSVHVIKSGISDTLQDGGRFGFQHLGINPSGVMDACAMQVSNLLVGNPLTEAVLEMSFPAASLYFKSGALISICGADFAPKLNGVKIPVHTPIMVAPESELKFSSGRNGRFCYLSVMGGFSVHSWLGSNSTNLKAGVGGFEGRKLRKGDELRLNIGLHERFRIFPWRASVNECYSSTSTPKEELSIRCIAGHEWDWLTKKSQSDFLKKDFTIRSHSDRMGYQLEGPLLKQSSKEQLLSTAVTWGTVQLLPGGNLIVLMADHQTTGGYPRIGHVIQADRSRLAQCRSHERISFQLVSVEEAEELAWQQMCRMNQLKWACQYKLREYIVT